MDQLQHTLEVLAEAQKKWPLVHYSARLYVCDCGVREWAVAPLDVLTPAKTCPSCGQDGRDASKLLPTTRRKRS
jgi:hypothetical protein